MVHVYDLEGLETLRKNLSSFGFSRPVVGNLTPAPGHELVVVDFEASTFVFDGDGTVLWNVSQPGNVFAAPVIADFDADGTPELAVGSSAQVALFEHSGEVAWQADVSATWMTTGQVDSDDAIEVIAAAGKQVTALDGRTGRVEWRFRTDPLAAVHALGDGDGDGQMEVYVTDSSGVVYALDASDGTAEWQTQLTSEEVQMTPPPVLGDFDGDGAPELVAVTNNGIVSVLDPATGEVIASYKREVTVWTHPTVANLDSDDADEILIMYGDGRVVALDYAP